MVETNDDQLWRLESGATLTKGGTFFRVWAPLADRLSLGVTSPHPAVLTMDRDGEGNFSVFAESLGAGADYYYEFASDRHRPDPVSRFQPHGVHNASQVVDPEAFLWTDRNWKGRALEDFIIYELHTGTFTPRRTFDGVIGRLPYLRDLGITALELMPVATFPRYRTPWGSAINFDGPQSAEVRRFFIDNALYWLTEYHVDALRLDAIHEIFDFGAYHLLHEMADAFHRQARLLGRHAWLIAESDLNDPRVINSPTVGGHGLDAQWNDDFHHSLHTLMTGARNGYFADFGRIEDLRKAITDGFVYDGRRSTYRQRRHGASSASNPGRQFVVFNQNHDQVANADAGRRFSELLTLEQQKLAAAILICAPGLPMLFMGEEFGASSPFNYFTSFTDPALARAVSEGRRREYESFFRDRPFPDPQALDTFAGSQLDWTKTAGSPHRELLALHRALIALRKENRCLSNCRKDLTEVSLSEGAREDARWMVIRRHDPAGAIALIFCNLSSAALTVPIPRETPAFALALFTGEQRFGGTPVAPSPPAVLDSSSAGIILARFSAALYLCATDHQ